MIIYPGIFFLIFSKFWFYWLLGGKRVENCPKWQEIMSVALHISGTMHHMMVIYVMLVYNNNISRYFFIFSKFWFSGLKKKSIQCSQYLRNWKSYDHDFWCTCVKWWYLLDVFFHFLKIFIFNPTHSRKKKYEGMVRTEWHWWRFLVFL